MRFLENTKIANKKLQTWNNLVMNIMKENTLLFAEELEICRLSVKKYQRIYEDNCQNPNYSCFTLLQHLARELSKRRENILYFLKQSVKHHRSQIQSFLCKTRLNCDIKQNIKWHNTWDNSAEPLKNIRRCVPYVLLQPLCSVLCLVSE